MNASFHKVRIDTDRTRVLHFDSDEDRGAFYAIDIVIAERAGYDHEGLSTLTLYINADAIADFEASLCDLLGKVRRAATDEKDLEPPF